MYAILLSPLVPPTRTHIYHINTHGNHSLMQHIHPSISITNLKSITPSIVYSENKMNWWLARATGDHPGKASSYELNLFYVFYFNFLIPPFFSPSNAN